MSGQVFGGCADSIAPSVRRLRRQPTQPTRSVLRFSSGRDVTRPFSFVSFAQCSRAHLFPSPPIPTPTYYMYTYHYTYIHTYADTYDLRGSCRLCSERSASLVQFCQWSRRPVLGVALAVATDNATSTDASRLAACFNSRIASHRFCDSRPTHCPCNGRPHCVWRQSSADRLTCRHRHRKTCNANRTL